MRLVTLTILAAAISSFAVIPEPVNYQGHLTRIDGTPLDTTVQMTFRLHDELGNPGEFWSETHPAVVVENGLFHVRLGSISPLDYSSIADITTLDGGALSVQVGSDAVMTPQIPLSSVFYSRFTGTVDKSSGGTITGDVHVEGKGNIGTANTNPGLWAFVVGEEGEASGNYSSVGGGYDNHALSNGSVIGGGISNQTSGVQASIGGGYGNQATNTSARVGGGTGNTASGYHSTIGGGGYHRASGIGSFIGGGGGFTPADSNLASGGYSSVTGGHRNIASGDHSVVGGGVNNRARGASAVVAGGGSEILADSNYAGGIASTIGGGQSNHATSSYCTVAGGFRNRLNNAGGTISGGQYNTADLLAVVAGGYDNDALQSYAVVSGGYQNTADAVGATIGGGLYNNVTSDGGVVGGGFNNTAANTAVVAGGDSNSATDIVAFVGGGRYNTSDGFAAVVGGGLENSVSNAYSTIGGGRENVITSTNATVAGGLENLVTGSYATISGGRFGRVRANYATVVGGGGSSLSDSNSARGESSTILGGRRNETTGRFSLAAGFRARAVHDGAFVWADSSGADFSSNAADQFNVRSSGGINMWTNSTATIGVTLIPGDNTWNSICDSTLKTRIEKVNGREMLEKIAELPVYRWHHKDGDPNLQHIGPMAQDFWNAFKVGGDSLKISTIDPSGVALAAIQELAKENEERKAMNEELKKEVQDLRAVLQGLLAEKQKSSLTTKE